MSLKVIEADVALAALCADRAAISPRWIADRREDGILPTSRKGLGRGKGSTSSYCEGADRTAIALHRSVHDGRSLTLAVLEAFRERLPVKSRSVRAAIVSVLEWGKAMAKSPPGSGVLDEAEDDPVGAAQRWAQTASTSRALRGTTKGMRRNAKRATRHLTCEHRRATCETCGFTRPANADVVLHGAITHLILEPLAPLDLGEQDERADLAVMLGSNPTNDEFTLLQQARSPDPDLVARIGRSFHLDLDGLIERVHTASDEDLEEARDLYLRLARRLRRFLRFLPGFAFPDRDLLDPRLIALGTAMLLPRR